MCLNIGDGECNAFALTWCRVVCSSFHLIYNFATLQSMLQHLTILGFANFETHLWCHSSLYVPSAWEPWSTVHRAQAGSDCFQIGVSSFWNEDCCYVKLVQLNFYLDLKAVLNIWCFYIWHSRVVLFWNAMRRWFIFDVCNHFITMLE